MSIQRIEDRWTLTRPDGTPFFSLGVCCVNQGIAQTAYDPENPSYAAWRQYANSNAWADSTLRRLKSWGITTLGGWSEAETLKASPECNLHLTPVLHIGAGAGAPWWDMWDEKNIRRMDETARSQIQALRGDPRIIGYFSDNELGWWNATLWKMTLEQPSASGQRRRLIQLLKTSYSNNWERLTQDFQPENARNWSELGRGGVLFLKSGGQGIHVMRQFLGLLADRYYGLMRELIRKHDPNALYLGDRYQSFYYPEVAEAAGRHVDACSSNLNASWNDGTTIRSYLDTLHALTKKPILITEFYLAAQENRSGNRNNYGGYPVVQTQAERTAAARNTLRQLAGLPYVLGADWFQYADEPRHGREDGENFNFGLVDIEDRPYEDLTRMFAEFQRTTTPGAATVRPDASSGIPPAPADPFANFTGTGAIKSWDRERGFVPPATPNPVGDLYVCWSSNTLYFGVHSFDIVEPAYYRNASVPKQDRATWSIQVNGKQVLQARIGAGREPLYSNPGVRVESLSGVNLNVRSIAAAGVPSSLFGKEALTPGDEVDIECRLATHCQAYVMQWRGKYKLTP